MAADASGANSGEIHLTYLNHADVASLAMTDAEIVAAVEGALRAQGLGQTTIEPRMHLVPEKDWPGHFNVLRGYIRPLQLAGVKVVGDFYRNYEQGLPSELAVLNLFDPRNGAPVAIIDASDITDMRTGAVTAIGARHLARKGSKVLGHIGARGTAYWNVRLLHSIFAFDEIRVHSRRQESRDAFAARLRTDLPGANVIVTEDWESCVRGADIVVETTGQATLSQSIAAAAVNGRVVIIGALAGNASEGLPNYGTIIGKNLTLRGIAEGSRAMLADFVRAAEVGGLLPVISKRFAFADAPTAYAYLKSAKHVGKVLISMP